MREDKQTKNRIGTFIYLCPIAIDLDCTTQNKARGFGIKIYWTCYLNDIYWQNKETKEEQDDYIKSILVQYLRNQ
jgi:hypothetical protein